MARLCCLLFVLSAMAIFPGPASAAEADSPAVASTGNSPAPSRRGPPVGWSTQLGAAVIVNPEFQGSNTYNVLPVPYFDFRYTDEMGLKHFANVPQGFGTYFYRAQDRSGVRKAASVALAPGFANRNPDDFDGLDTFGPGIEARLGFEIGSRRWGMSATVAQALGSGHEGLYLDLAASWRQRVGQLGFLSIGPVLRLGDDNYMSALYGVTDREADRTGLSAFDAGAGLERIGLQGVLSIPLTGKWQLTTVGRIGTLLTDAEDSSLTEEPFQVFFLTAVTRQF